MGRNDLTTIQRQGPASHEAGQPQLTSAGDPDATLNFTYDSGGNQLTAQTSGGGTGEPNVTLMSTYDEVGRRLTLLDNLASKHPAHGQRANGSCTPTGRTQCGAVGSTGNRHG